MNARELAIFLHNEYERQAKVVGWKTQDSCQVEFDKLPEANKRVMLTVAQAVIDAGFVRLEDVEMDVEELEKIVNKSFLTQIYPGFCQQIREDIVKAKPIRVKEAKK